MNRRFVNFSALCALCAAGAIAALSFAPSAFAWSPTNLPPGFSTIHIIDSSPTSPCPSAYRIFGPGGVGTDPLCENSPTYQADFDAFIDAHYTAPATTTAATTTAAASTTQADTTTTSPTTTAETATTPPPAQTAPTSTVPGCDLQCQVDALTVQLAQIRSELSRLEQILEAWPSVDPGILAQLMSLHPPS